MSEVNTQLNRTEHCTASVKRRPFPQGSSWRKLDAGPFSISAPPGWEFHQLAGVDSYVGLVEPRAQSRMIAVDGFGESGLRFNLVFFLNGVFCGLESNPS